MGWGARCALATAPATAAACRPLPKSRPASCATAVQVGCCWAGGVLQREWEVWWGLLEGSSWVSCWCHLHAAAEVGWQVEGLD